MAGAPACACQVLARDVNRGVHHLRRLLHTLDDHLSHRAVNNGVNTIFIRVALELTFFDASAFHHHTLRQASLDKCLGLLFVGELPHLLKLVRHLKLVFIVVVDDTANAFIIPASFHQLPVQENTDQVEQRSTTVLLVCVQQGVFGTGIDLATIQAIDKAMRTIANASEVKRLNTRY